MNKSVIDSYGPVYLLIKKLETAPAEERDAIIRELSIVGEKAYVELQQLSDEYIKIKESYQNLEERLTHLNAYLDERMAKLSTLEIADSEGECIAIYKEQWEKLDAFSQRYLIMANYLFKLFSESENDYSPSVLEFGRAVENELLKKIYEGFIGSLVRQNKRMVDQGSKYGSIKRAVKDYQNKEGQYYVPAKEMVNYLSYISNPEIENEYNKALIDYLEQQRIDVETVSENSFTSTSYEIFDKYRNAAAHPGGVLLSSDASSCRDKSQIILKSFMSAVNES